MKSDITFPVMDRSSLKAKIRRLSWLNDDWDGFGSVPITLPVSHVGEQVIDAIPVNVDYVLCCVGSDPPGSLIIECYTTKRKRTVEFTVNPNLTVDFSDYFGEMLLSSGSFPFEADMVSSLLKE